MNRSKAQRGAVLLVGLIILMTAMAAGLIALFSQRMGEVRKEAQTAQTLALAKQGLLGYAWNAAWWNAAARACATSTTAGCPRPGDLPCPDMHSATHVNVGTPGNDTGNCPANALGRLPWKTLGLPDLRDATGERLWYARSERFRTINRLSVATGAGPLNPDTVFGQIAVYANNGSALLHDPSAGTGAVAILIAPGAPLLRLDNVLQNRSAADYLNAAHYLDCWGTGGCNVDDNANFAMNSATNGFVSGPIRTTTEIAVNDRILTVSRDEMLAGMTRAVANNVAMALDEFYSANWFMPSPADFNNQNCLGSASLTGCISASNVLAGRIPAQFNVSPSLWPVSKEAKILLPPNTRWFQQNGWREYVYYAVAPTCANDSLNCVAGGGMLTVNNPPYTAATNKRAVIIVGGAALAGQLRSTTSDRTNPGNYFEEQNNSVPLDTVFARRPVLVAPATPFNDVVATVPR